MKTEPKRLVDEGMVNRKHKKELFENIQQPNPPMLGNHTRNRTLLCRLKTAV
ncbi:hypothetical protein EV294_103224 [Paenibacillus sp. BK033]|nr:hypothetical protein EV294_103224 [Paenibacillus sp. BK033]